MKPLASKPAACACSVPCMLLRVHMHLQLTYHSIQALALVALCEVLYAELKGLGVQQKRGHILEQDALLQQTTGSVQLQHLSFSLCPITAFSVPWGSLAPL